MLIALAYRGWSILLLAPAAALVVAAFAREPLLAHWTQTFMSSTAEFLGKFFPLFLLGALFGKLMDDSGSVRAIARFIVERLGPRHAILAIVLAGAAVTYGGVSLFVAFFVLAPMAQEVFRAADIPRRLMPAAIALGTLTFTMSAAPGTPAIQNAVVMPFLGTKLFAAPGLGLIASAIMLGFGLGWLHFAEIRARRAGEGFGTGAVGTPEAVAADPAMRARATTARPFDPAEIGRGQKSAALPPVVLAALPLVVVVGVNLLMAWLILPRLDAAYLAEERWGATSLSAVGGVWSVVVALAAGILILVVTSRERLPALRDSIDAGAHASVLPALTVASLVGFGAVVAAVPAFASVSNLVLSTGKGVLVPLAVTTNVLRPHRYGRRQHHDHLPGSRRDAAAPCGRAARRPRASTSRGYNRRRNARQLAPQRRHRGAARGVRSHAPRELLEHCSCCDHRSCDRPRGRRLPRQRFRGVLRRGR
jgi:H+/gluconate symporter-like permease